jgi:hypothetical protein
VFTGILVLTSLGASACGTLLSSFSTNPLVGLALGGPLTHATPHHFIGTPQASDVSLEKVQLASDGSPDGACRVCGAVPAVFFPMITFSGILYQRSDTPPYLKWMETASIVNYGVSAIIATQADVLPPQAGPMS